MSLKSITETFLPYLLKKKFRQNLFNEIEQKDFISVKECVGSSASIIIAELFLTQKKNILYLLHDKEECLYAVTELEELVGNDHILYFPPSHTEPYYIEKIQNANLVLRTEVIKRIHWDKNPKIILAPFLAIAEKVLQKKDFSSISNTIRIGDNVGSDFIDKLLTCYRFQQTDFVSSPGEFSVRGGIIDIFSFGNKEPYRIAFFGNEIESIKTFDIETQLSKEKIQEFQLVSNMNFLTFENKVPFFKLLQRDSIIFTKNADLGLKSIKDFYERAETNYQKLSRKFNHPTPEELFIPKSEAELYLSKFKHIHFASALLSNNLNIEEKNNSEIFLQQYPQPSFHKNFELLAEDLRTKKDKGYDTWISFSTEKQKERLENIFNELNYEIPFRSFFSNLHEGFVDTQLKISVYTNHQIFGRYQRFKNKNTFAKSEQLTLKDLVSLKIGDFITHIDHGIGKFMGLIKVNNNGKIQECFKITYKNGDLLYVSVYSLHKISKYNPPEGKEVKLSKLGSAAWKNLKQKTKSKIKKIAFDLIKLYAQRKSAKGFAFTPDTYLQNELEASFIYEDTPDQEKANVEVKRDMEAETIMDRLICGDVGFGKTEIAIRAAFKAATDGKQTAVLVPTTILAFQHYRSFSERLKNFPVEVSFLNRFRTAKQKSETKKRLKEGKIDIVIGTHQLVGKDIEFKNLGLLIIDEEHKFGVNVKDKLKTLKNNIDTLTLTATPIPRTLQFSLMAARDLSVIKTPPPNRQSINTQIIRFDEEILRDAISYELQRSGQVYFINNRIENIKEISGIIQRLVPDAKIITGHGQMEGKQLEQNILDFMEGKYDILISTTIIESGVDVPNANTIFINDAQKFGIADLHQIRGRVGRSNRKAFCYLITPPNDMITSDARKRLEAIEQFSDLGSGFQIAMKDLEIRGAGDLLGAEQSGFINEIGFDTYQKIMQEALEELQNDSEFENLFENEEDRKKLIKTTKEVNIDTDMELLLPDDYIQNTEERLILYQKLTELQNKNNLQQFENELIDRFGKLPSKAKNLLKSVELKWLASDIGFEKLVMKNNIFLGYLPSNPQDKFYASEKFKKIISYLNSNPNEATLKEKQSKENCQLMIKKGNIKNIDDVTELLKKIQN